MAAGKTRERSRVKVWHGDKTQDRTLAQEPKGLLRLSSNYKWEATNRRLVVKPSLHSVCRVRLRGLTPYPNEEMLKASEETFWRKTWGVH